MVAMVASQLADLWPDLTGLSLGFGSDEDHGAISSEAASILGQVIDFCVVLKWEDLESQAIRLLAKVESGATGEIATALADDLRAAIQSRLERLCVVVIEDHDLTFYRNAAISLCGGRLCAELATSEEELNLAGKAYAFGLTTAAVSHAMRAIEASLRIVARRLGVQSGTPIDLQNWINLTELIGSEIRKQQAGPRTVEKTSYLQTLSELVVLADGFRLAWRNYVQHARETYEAQEARPILEHAGRFLKKLSVVL